MIGFMCGVDYQHEVDPDTLGHAKVYGSVEALKKDRSCWKQCGIVAVKIEVYQWIEQQNFEHINAWDKKKKK